MLPSLASIGSLVSLFAQVMSVKPGRLSRLVTLGSLVGMALLKILVRPSDLVSLSRQVFIATPSK